MYKFFEETYKVQNERLATISDDKVRSFRLAVENELISNGNEEYIKLIGDTMIRSAILNKRKPEDVAWALTQ